MKKEIPRVLKEVSNDHNLDIIKPSMLFKTRMEKGIKSKKMNTGIVLEWKKDDGKYSCHIWEWWREKMEELSCFRLALRLVVLSHLSICPAERVFLVCI